jgi:rubredoxin
MLAKCSKCWGELDTGYVCKTCGTHNPPQTFTTSDKTVIRSCEGGWCPIHGNECPARVVYDSSLHNAAGQGRRVATYPEPACSPLHPCALCGRTEYPVEYGPRQNKLPAGSLVGFDNGERVWICRRCSRDPAALERLETDVSLTANADLTGQKGES